MTAEDIGSSYAGSQQMPRAVGTSSLVELSWALWSLL